MIFSLTKYNNDNHASKIITNHIIPFLLQKKKNILSVSNLIVEIGDDQCLLLCSEFKSSSYVDVHARVGISSGDIVARETTANILTNVVIFRLVCENKYTKLLVLFE